MIQSPVGDVPSFVKIRKGKEMRTNEEKVLWVGLLNLIIPKASTQLIQIAPECGLNRKEDALYESRS